MGLDVHKYCSIILCPPTQPLRESPAKPSLRIFPVKQTGAAFTIGTPFGHPKEIAANPSILSQSPLICCVKSRNLFPSISLRARVALRRNIVTSTFLCRSVVFSPQGSLQPWGHLHPDPHPGDIQRCLEASGEGGCYWHLVGRSQGQS